MDNAYLTGPQGTQLNIGSWLQVDQPPDYGAHDVIKQVVAQNPFVDGGQFAYEYAPPRTMRFPLLVASGGVAGLSLDTVESYLRTMARPGGFIDLQPDGTPTAERVRFDVLGGRVNHDQWSLPLQRVDRRRLTVELDVQPFGYWPTWITLASVSAQAVPFTQVIQAGSVIGDAPGHVRLFVAPSAASSVATALGIGSIDFLAWSLAGGPSHLGLLSGASFVQNNSTRGTWRSDTNASGIGGPTVLDMFILPVGSIFGNQANADAEYFFSNIGGPGAVAVQGRHRVFMWAKLGPSGAMPMQAVLDSGGRIGQFGLASANQVATIIPAAASGAFAGMTPWGNAASPAYTFYDLGEIAIPRVPEAASIANFQDRLRLFVKPASSGATQTLSLAGMWLHPVGGPNAIIGQGLAQPTIGGANAAAGANKNVQVDSEVRSVVFGTMGGAAPPGAWPEPDMTALYFARGVMPQLGASTITLSVVAEARISVPSAATGPMIHTARTVAAYSLQYRPRFQFLRGL